MVTMACPKKARMRVTVEQLKLPQEHVGIAEPASANSAHDCRLTVQLIYGKSRILTVDIPMSANNITECTCTCAC